MSEPITDIHLNMPWGQTITFPPHKPLAHGMRLSGHCPVQRVASYFDEEVLPPFDPGVGAIGHLYAYLWCHQTAQGNDVLEQPVAWTHGNAHIDRIIPDGEHAGVYEIKTSSAKDPRPTVENVAQVMRYQRAAREAGMADLADLPWYIVCIGKAGNESGWVRGPWQVTLDDDSPVNVPDVFAGTDEILTGKQYALWDADATDAMKQVVHDNIDKMDIPTIISQPDLVGNYCACGQHRLAPPVPIDDSQLLAEAGRYLEARGLEKEQAEAKTRGLAALRAAAADWKPGRYDVGDVRVTKNDEGKVTIR